METIFYILSIMVLPVAAFSGLIATTKKPRSGMKNSFAFLSLVIFISNLFFLLEYHSLFHADDKFSLGLDYLLFVSSLNFVYFFPNHFRNMPVLNQTVWFLFGGLAFGFISVMIHSQSILNIQKFILPVVYLSSGILIYKKTWKYFPNIKSFMRTGLGLFLLIFLFYILLIVFHEIGKIAKLPEPIHIWNLSYFLIYNGFLLHFTFRDEYISTPLSSVMERSRLVLREIQPASPKGTQALKESLMKYYEDSHLTNHIEEFHFHLLADETIDNALEHGGKRSYDDISVYVFESPKYTDVYVIDRGKGFNPQKIPSPLEKDRKLIPSGRGIHLLKELFKVRWNFLGNEICVRIVNPPRKSK